MTGDKKDRFEEDLAWLARHERWAREDLEEVRRNIDRHGNPAIRFWWCLAKATQKGYRFDAQSGYERLQDFCVRVGMPGPVARKHEARA